MPLHIDLDPPAGGGGEPTGAVVFTAAKDVTPRRVTVELAWTTRGRGDRAGGVLASGEVDVGPVAAGETVRVPLSFAPPADLVRPFAGELIELAYVLRARVDLPWAFDETAEVDVPLA